MGNFRCWNYVALVFVVLPCFFASEATSSSSRTQAEALLKWKSSLSIPSSYVPDPNPWSLSNLKNLCNWSGIVCNGGGSVSEINLDHFYFVYGTLHHLNFTCFPSLKRFDISDRGGLHGSIPPAIGNLFNLVYLDLSYNEFTGVIPHQIGNLKKVRFLDLGFNFFDTHHGWSKFKSFPVLRHLSFSIITLTSFPDFILDCRNLTFLDLSGTLLNGSIPKSLFTNLDKLEHLDLSGNDFAGPLSPNIANLSNLKYLQLSENSFVGEIPSSIGQLKHLQFLDITANLLNSSIPFEIGGCTNLTHLSLSYNSLYGAWPSSLLLLSPYMKEYTQDRDRVRLKKCFGLLPAHQKPPLKHDMMNNVVVSVLELSF
nr:receptor-like protein 12 [Ipomoea trifida]